ncbi:MAG: efflux RND transporter periplasmic adaptor subunit [Gemmataceae bacterium]
MLPRFAGTLVLVCSILGLVQGCTRPKMPEKDSSDLPVEVSLPILKSVVDNLEFTGRLDAQFSLDVRARVTGYIVETPYKEGDLVKKGAILFKIDPRPYQAKLDDALAYLEFQKAKLKLARADNLRAKETAKTPGAISKQDLDKYQAAEEEARAGVKSAEASTEIHKLNLVWCTVDCPIDGRVSRYFLTLGNLINQDQTLLTTVVSEDPIYAYCDADERSLLRVRRGLESGRIKANEKGDIPIFMSLADEVGFPHQGLLNFVNNRVDPLTGTITLRAVFKNPPIKNGRRLFAPGMFVRMRIPLGDPQPAVLVAERTLVTDQGMKNVFIVDEENKVKYRRVELGALQPDGLRVITSGLEGKERVLLTGLQMVRPGMKVDPQTVAMPVLNILQGVAGGSSKPADKK